VVLVPCFLSLKFQELKWCNLSLQERKFTWRMRIPEVYLRSNTVTSVTGPVSVEIMYVSSAECSNLLTSIIQPPETRFEWRMGIPEVYLRSNTVTCVTGPLVFCLLKLCMSQVLNRANKSLYVWGMRIPEGYLRFNTVTCVTGPLVLSVETLFMSQVMSGAILWPVSFSHQKQEFVRRMRIPEGYLRFNNLCYWP
jgi:hypothetical protein